MEPRMPRFNPLRPIKGAVPPAEVRFRDLHAEPWEDNRRIRVHIRLTPFQKPPNLEIQLFDAQGQEVASASVIENVDFDLVVTLHIRPPDAAGPFTLTGSIGYEDIGEVDRKSVTFSLSGE